MDKNIKVVNMEDKHVDKAKEIWREQYRKYCNDEMFPQRWGSEGDEFEKFLKWKIKNDNAVVAILEEELVGFLAFDMFPFNGELTAFCPAIGHGACELQ